MNCSNCQAQIPENSKVCPYCGTPVEAQSAPQQPAYQQPAYQPVPTQPAYQPVSTQPAPTANDPQKDALAGSCLTWGILGLAFSEVPILGLIFSIIAVKAYKLNEPGRGIAIGGLICSIIGCFVAVIWIIVLALIIGAATAYGYSDTMRDAFRDSLFLFIR